MAGLTCLRRTIATKVSAAKLLRSIHRETANKKVLAVFASAPTEFLNEGTMDQAMAAVNKVIAIRRIARQRVHAEKISGGSLF
ncbi:MAG: hypothetical protein WAZ34_07245 [Rhodocyclaceae bacterium]